MTRLSLVQGDTAVLRVEIQQADGSAFDLDGWAIDFTIKRSQQDSNAAAVFHGTLAGGEIVLVTTTDAGLIDVTVPADKSVLMRIGRKYYWDCQVNKDGFVFTPCDGVIYAEGGTTTNE